jgi:predicted esterase
MPTEHHLKIPRSARYYTLGDDVREPAELWMACHGYGQLAERFLTRLTPLDDGRRLIVAPEALSRFYVAGSGGPDSKVGASWMTREDRLREMEDYVAYLDAVHDEVAGRRDRKGAKLRVLGFSQGAATAARWALRGRARVDRLILWAGLLPPEIEPRVEADRLNTLDLVVVAGEQDEWVTAGLPIMTAALEEAGVRYRLITFDGGHALDEVTLRRLAEI